MKIFTVSYSRQYEGISHVDYFSSLEAARLSLAEYKSDEEAWDDVRWYDSIMVCEVELDTQKSEKILDLEPRDMKFMTWDSRIAQMVEVYI